MSMIAGRIDVVVGSTNLVKVDAVKAAFTNQLGLEDLTLIAVKVISGVSDQPIGLEETRLGAFNRMKNAFQVSGAKIHYTVGVENGMVKGEELSTFFNKEFSKKHWYDIAVVVVIIFNHSCQYSYASYAKPIQIPNTEIDGMLPPDHPDGLDANLAKYSEVIMPLINGGKDIYDVFSEGKRSRGKTIEQAASNALSKLHHVRVIGKDEITKVDTVITFGTFDLFHDLHRRLIRQSFAVGKRLVVYVYNKESKRKGDGRVSLHDSVQKRIETVAKFALEISKEVIVRRMKDKHHVELEKAIIEFKKSGTVAVFGGEDQMCYEKMLDLCFNKKTPVVTISRGDDGTGLCSSDIREKLSYKPIVDRYNLEGEISPRLLKSRIRSLAQAKEYLRNLRFFGAEVAEVWKYRQDFFIDQQLRSPALGKKKIVVCLPGRTRCDLDRIRKVLLTNVQMLELPSIDLDYYLICYRDDAVSTKFYIDNLESDPWSYFSDDAMIVVRDLLLPRITENASVVKEEGQWIVQKNELYKKESTVDLSGVTFFTRSRGSVIALEVENALLFCMNKLGYLEAEIRLAAKQVAVVSICNLASLERGRLFSTVSFTGINDQVANNYITGFTNRFSKLYSEEGAEHQLSDNHRAILTKVPENIQTYSKGEIITIEDSKHHYTPLYISKRIGVCNTIPELIIEKFQNFVRQGVSYDSN